MAKYRKRPVVIDAEPYCRFGTTPLQMEALCDGSTCTWSGKKMKAPHIHTLEGAMKVSEGDFIVRGVRGEFYPVKPDIFEQTYEPIEE